MGARPSSFKSEPKPVKATRVWSAQQLAIFDWFAIGNGNLVVRARAGTGKTTVILEGINRAPEESILLCAFNKRIADELSTRIENGAAEVKTLHSLGYQMIRREWRGLPVEKQRGARADYLTDLAMKPGETLWKEKTPFQIRRMISNLHSKAREMSPLTWNHDELLSLAFRFDYVPDEGWGKYNLEFVIDRALAVLTHASTEPPTYDVGIDYADMIFLPLAHNLTSRDYQLVVVDEAQDMTHAQLEIAQRVCQEGGRICVVGDDKQAIYGFRGADSGSLDRLKKELNATELPLTTTYRCGSFIVDHAQRLVADIEPLDGIHQGEVVNAPESALDEAKPGDFILSRLNAPLVAITLRLLRNQKRAKMAGRDIGSSVAAVLKKLKVFDGTPIDDTIRKIVDWESKMATRLAANGQEDQIARIRDMAGVLYALAEDAESTGDLLRNCDYLFTDDQDAGQILCSSVHKAKGLEASRVYLLMDTFYTRGTTDEERNIEYVAITRAKDQLILVRREPQQ